VLVRLFRQAARPGLAGRPCAVEVGGGTEEGGPSFWVRQGQAPDLAWLAALREPTPADPDAFLVRQVVAGWGAALRVRADADGAATCTLLFPVQGPPGEENAS
jgi:hypothetical protein